MSQEPIDRLRAALQGRYTVERKLGEGGMATVYLGRDLRHERPVAIKVLKSDLAAVVGAERFLAEIKTTAGLQHPHILPLHDSGEANGLLFYVMPYIEGESLRDRLERERQLPIDTAVAIATRLAEALDYAHRRGVIHRDIKPGNILLQDGQPLLADFGIALAVTAGGGDRLTHTGLSVGTPNYMSPEQATGERTVGPPSDVFALGCVLHEMLAGEPPFAAATPQAVLARVLSGRAADVRESRRGVPRNVEAVVARTLEPVPADRFPAASDMARALADPGFRHGTAGVDEDSVRRWKGVSGAAGAAALTFAALWAMGLGSNEIPAPVIKYVQDFPAGEELWEAGSPAVALSPDGTLLVYPGPGERLWLRPRDQLQGEPIPGTEGGSHPAFSPDGTRIAFVTSRSELKVASLSREPLRTVVEANVRLGAGVAWGPDGYLYFTLLPSLGLHRVRWNDDAPPEQLTSLNTDQVRDPAHPAGSPAWSDGGSLQRRWQRRVRCAGPPHGDLPGTLPRSNSSMVNLGPRSDARWRGLADRQTLRPRPTGFHGPGIPRPLGSGSKHSVDRPVAERPVGLPQRDPGYEPVVLGRQERCRNPGRLDRLWRELSSHFARR